MNETKFKQLIKEIILKELNLSDAIFPSHVVLFHDFNKRGSFDVELFSAESGALNFMKKKSDAGIKAATYAFYISPKGITKESVAPGEEERGKFRHMLFNLYKNQAISKEVLKDMMGQFEKASQESYERGASEAEHDLGEMPE